MSSNTDSPASVSVWYFVGATFAFASTSLYPDSPLWLRIVTMILGFVLVVIGGYYLSRELGARRARNGTRPPEPDEHR